ncbi:MAG: DegT/DnrJ/EryC1/StrS family aminotransferase [Candidatus Rokubacteria bacterium]|nr:DegT/DnrJ/EryC1/StrS family aminotransferase [Candidatus Rokubacteria bacterium]
MIKLIKSTFYNEADTKKELVDFILKNEQLSFGAECMKFEKNFAAWQGRRDAVFVNSGSSANLALVQALLNFGRLKPGDAVGFSALTWSTNIMPLVQLGLVPVSIDVTLETLNVSSATLAAAVDTTPIKALFLTNLLGFCDDMDGIRRLCRERGILLLEDNCEGLGTVYRGTKLGNFGLAATFSFFVGHHLSTIEGGAIATDDLELATMLRIVRAHGWDRNLAQEERDGIRRIYRVDPFYAKYTFYDLAFNIRPMEIQAFLGNSELRHADEIVKKRDENFKRFAAAIYSQTGRYLPIRFDHLDLVSNFAVPVVCASASIRDKLVTRCEGRIETRPIVGGDMTRQPFFVKYLPIVPRATGMTNAALVHQNGLYFGNNPQLTEDEIEQMIALFSS